MSLLHESDGAFTDDMTLGDAREALRGMVQDGARCPCCTQYAKVYRRTIHAQMARELISFWRQNGTQLTHLPDSVVARGGDMVKVRYWGLIREEPATREDGSTRAGYWRVTPLGEQFVRGEVTVPTYAHIFDGRCLRVAGEPRGIKDCLGNKFNYAELMADPGSMFEAPKPAATAYDPTSDWA